MTKDLHRVVSYLLKEGWTLAPRGRTGHARVVAPAGSPTIPVPSTPSDHRTMANFVADLRKAGVTWPPPPRKGRKR